MDGSPYGGMALCETFPRDYNASNPNNDQSWPIHLAQVGKADVPRANFDDMFTSMITIFQVRCRFDAQYVCPSLAYSSIDFTNSALVLARGYRQSTVY